MKLLFITQEYSSVSAGGAGVYAYELARALSTGGTETHVIAPSNKTFIEQVSPNLTVHWFKVIDLPLLRIPTFHIRVFLSARRISAKYQIDSVHSNNYAGIFAFTKLSLIGTIHHPISGEYKQLSVIQRFISFPDVIFEKVLLKRANYIVTVSHLSDSLLSPMVAKNKLKIIPNGVDASLFRYVDSESLRNKLGIAKNEIILFFPGGARAKRKGALDLLAAFSLINHLKFRCIISGTSREIGWQNGLKSAIKDLGFDNKFIWVNEIKYSNLPNYYSAADIVVYPSTFEGFGLPILEALACERPLICSLTGEAPYIINNGKNGLLMDVHDHKQLAKHLENLIVNKTLRETLSNNARSSITDYTWENVAAEITKLHHEDI